jgi:orotidine-5'-phosphate decarboxylase
MTFINAIEARWKRENSLLCIGLDSDLNKIPAHLRKKDTPLFTFNKAIIDSTADLVCAFKPQIAYYSASGSEDELEMTIEHIHENYPEIPVILDAKRGDIGATAEMYAKEAFQRKPSNVIKLTQ